VTIAHQSADRNAAALFTRGWFHMERWFSANASAPRRPKAAQVLMAHERDAKSCETRVLGSIELFTPFHLLLPP
jgi:hypothetical protein